MVAWRVFLGAIATLTTTFLGARGAMAQIAVPQTAVPSVLKVLPADASGVILVNTEPGSWENLTRFRLFPVDFTLPGMVGSSLMPNDGFLGLLRGKPKANLAVLNFSVDVLPWLGDRLAYGYLKDGSFVTVAAVKDSSKVPAFLTKLAKSRTPKPQTLTYNNAQIVAWEPEPIPAGPMGKNMPVVVPQFVGSPKAPIVKSPPRMTAGFALAYLPGGTSHVIVAPTIAVLKDLLDSQKNASFSANPDFQKTLTDPRFGQALVVGFGDYKGITDSSRKMLEKTGSPFPMLQLEGPLKGLEDAYGNMEGFLWATPQGLQGEGTLYLKPNISPESLALLKSTDSSNQILSKLPAVTYGMFNANNLAFPMKTVMQAYGKNPQTKSLLDFARNFTQGLAGFDDRDLFPWMDKEFAGFLFPTQQGVFANMFKVEMGMGMLIQTSDRPIAEASLKKIQASLVKRYGKNTTVTKRTVNGTVFTSVNGKDEKSILAYSWVSPDTVLIVTGAESADRIVPKPWQALSDSTTFKAAIASLPTNNAGYVYLDGSATSAFIFNSIAPKFFPSVGLDSPEVQEYKASAGSIRHVVGTSLVRDDRIQVVARMELGPANRPAITAQGLVDKYRGERFFTSGKQIEDMSRALALDPKLTDAYLYRGKARLQRNDYLGALEDFAQVGDNKSTVLLASRGRAYFYLHDYEKAVVDMQAAIDSEPIKAELQDRELADLLFQSHMELGNYKLALEANNRLKEPNIETPATYYQPCDAKARLGDFAGAKKDCATAQKMYQEINQPDVLALKKELADQVKRGEITKAEAANQLKEQSVLLPLAQSCYARAALGDAAGLEECERLIAADPEDARAFEYLGLARSALKQVGNARQAYGKAIDLYQAQGNGIAVRRVQGLLKQLPGQ